MDGSGRHIVMDGVPHPFALTVFEDWMYWSDWNHMTIERARKFTGADHSVLRNMTHRPMDVHVYHPLMQIPGELKNYYLVSHNTNILAFFIKKYVF